MLINKNFMPEFYRRVLTHGFPIVKVNKNSKNKL
jgi:hypothetical protein